MSTSLGLAGRGVLAVVVVVAGLAGLGVAAPAMASYRAAAAPPAVLYAAVTAAGRGDCLAVADACTLSTALGEVAAGGAIELITPGEDTGGPNYVGNWTVSTPGTSGSAPVTILGAPWLASQPVLDGAGPEAPPGETCSTASCAGPVLTVPAGEHVALVGITIADGNNASTGTGGGLDNAGTVTIFACNFTLNNARDGGAIYSGGEAVTVSSSYLTGNGATNGGAIDNAGGGTVTVATSTFTGNGATDGGAIDSGDNTGGGTVTVTASFFDRNIASGDGGAIDSGDNRGGGTVTVAASLFSGNKATDGGAIDSGDDTGDGTMMVTASTFSGNSIAGPGDGGAIGSGQSGSGTVAVAGDVFDGSCRQPGGGTWTDGGYNAGSDATCFNAGIGDLNTGSGAALKLRLNCGGPTPTICPQHGSPVIGIIPDPTTVTLGSSQVALCPATDQRGYTSAAGTACDAGAVQTTGSPPSLTLAVSAIPGSFNRAGQVISYRYTASNTGTGTLTGIKVTADPAVSTVSCPSASLFPGTSEICAGSRIITRAALAARKITDTAGAAGVTADGVEVAGAGAAVTLHRGWPPIVSGSYRPAGHAAKGYYLSVTGSTWSLIVTHPGTGKVIFTGTVTLNAGAFTSLTPIQLGGGDSVQFNHEALTFRFTDSGAIKGLRFATGPAGTAITFTLDIGGHRATARQLYLGGTPTHPGRGSPLTVRR